MQDSLTIPLMLQTGDRKLGGAEQFFGGGGEQRAQRVGELGAGLGKLDGGGE